MTRPEPPAVTCQVRSGVATITLDSPQNRNALSHALRLGLLTHLAAAEADPDVRVVEITASGSVFCAGADLKVGMAEHRTPPTYVEVLTAVMTATKPILARVEGHVRGGGMGLVAAADLAIAARGVTFSYPEVRIGVIPAIASVPSLAVMSSRAAARHFLTGEPFGADDAVAAGLLTAACAPEELGALRDQLVGGMLQASPSALAGTKRVLSSIPGLQPADAFTFAELMGERFFETDDAAEGRAAFAEKRPPHWSRSLDEEGSARA